MVYNSISQVVPLCQKYGVDVLLSGHEHNLDHITKTVDRDIDYVISGGGGRGLYNKIAANERILNNRGLQVDYFGYIYGFVAFDFTPTSMLVEYVDEDGNIVYSFSRTKWDSVTYIYGSLGLG